MDFSETFIKVGRCSQLNEYMNFYEYQGQGHPLWHWLLEYYQVYSNDDPGLTLTYFTTRSNLVPFVFYGKMPKLKISK